MYYFFHFYKAQAYNSVSTVTQCTLPQNLSFPNIFYYNNDSIPDIVYYEKETSSLKMVLGDGNGKFSEQKKIAITTPFFFLTTAKLNKDSVDDIILVHRETSSIEILMSKKNGQYASLNYPVNYYPEKAICADINNDGIMDILSIGKLSSGISILFGKKNGTFVPSQNILSEIPISELYVEKLNDDNFIDIIYRNWLTEELVFCFGMGNLQFAEQSTIQLKSESAKFFCGNFNGDAIIDFAIASDETQNIQMYEGDGVGGYDFVQELLYTHQDFFSMASFSSKIYFDIITTNMQKQTFTIYINKGSGSFFNGRIFGITSTPLSILIADYDVDGYDDVLLIDSSPIFSTIYWNDKKNIVIPTDTSFEISYAVGKSPTSFDIADMNNDGYNDIITLNKESQTVSLLFSDSTRFNSQISFNVSDSSQSVKYYSYNDSSLTFIIPQTNGKISLVTTVNEQKFLQEKIFTYSTSVIPTIKSSSIIFSEKNSETQKNKNIEFYNYSSMKQPQLRYYKQVEGEKFIQRSFTPLTPITIFTSAVNDFNGDGKDDIAYIYTEKKSKQKKMGISIGDSTENYTISSVINFLPQDTLIKKCFFLFHDVNKDSILDCFFYSIPQKTLYTALGKRNGVFSEFVPIIVNSNIIDKEKIQIVDFNNDTIDDILLFDVDSLNVNFYQGNGDGTFLSSQILCPLPQNSQFRCVDMNNDGRKEIVYTDFFKNAVTIHYFGGN